VFGVSEQTALLVIALHYVAFSWGSWKLFSYWLNKWQALAATVMLVAAPEIAFWGRQVMLEIPSLAFVVWSAVFFTRYRREPSPRWLYLSIALLVLAIYTKLTAGFLAIVYLASLLTERRTALLRDRHVWGAAILGVIALLPLVVLTLKFGQANIQSATGIADSLVSRSSFAGWMWYLQRLPSQLGWPLVAVAILGSAILLWRRRTSSVLHGDALFWGLWFMLGYVFFSSIDLKEARHSLFILPPVVLAAAVALSKLLAKRTSLLACAALAVLVLGQTILMRPVHYVGGYAEAADFVSRKAARDTAVLFSGYRDGAFVFNMRAREDRRDLSVVRADKILLSVAVRRELGVKEKGLDEAEIGARIDKLGIEYVVAQPGFWDDLAVMQRFERVLASDQFEEVARIPTPANYPAHEKELVVYRNRHRVVQGGGQREIELPIIGRTIPAAR
jgi:predicted membrane-bound mannosyltransferase